MNDAMIGNSLIAFGPMAFYQVSSRLASFIYWLLILLQSILSIVLLQFILPQSASRAADSQAQGTRFAHEPVVGEAFDHCTQPPEGTLLQMRASETQPVGPICHKMRVQLALMNHLCIKVRGGEPGQSTGKGIFVGWDDDTNGIIFFS